MEVADVYELVFGWRVVEHWVHSEVTHGEARPRKDGSS